MTTTTTTTPETVAWPPGEPPDFSLVLGGPLFQLWRRAHLSDDLLQMVYRRVVVIAAVAWVPLLLLSLVEGRAWQKSVVAVPFFFDIEMHVRLLVALPLLILAELFVHMQMRPVMGQFLERNLVPDAGRRDFDAAIAAALRLRNSAVVEVLLIAIVYVVGVGLIWRKEVALEMTTWYGTPVSGELQPSLAGWYLGLVSLPIFQFLLLRWYFRIFIWARCLWMISRIKLNLVASHPDRCGGLSFLGRVPLAFAPVLFAHGALLCGLIANRIFFTGATLPSFQIDMATLFVVMMVLVLGPLLVFTTQLLATKQAGLLHYGALGQRYVRDFDNKWIRGGAPPDEALVGTGDIQSLADLANSFDVVTRMRLVPFNLQTIIQLGVISLAPVLPLTLTMFSLQQVVGMALKAVF